MKFINKDTLRKVALWAAKEATSTVFYVAIDQTVRVAITQTIKPLFTKKQDQQTK